MPHKNADIEEELVEGVEAISLETNSKSKLNANNKIQEFIKRFGDLKFVDFLSVSRSISSTTSIKDDEYQNSLISLYGSLSLSSLGTLIARGTGDKRSRGDSSDYHVPDLKKNRVDIPLPSPLPEIEPDALQDFLDRLLDQSESLFLQPSEQPQQFCIPTTANYTAQPNLPISTTAPCNLPAETTEQNLAAAIAFPNLPVGTIQDTIPTSIVPPNLPSSAIQDNQKVSTNIPYHTIKRVTADTYVSNSYQQGQHSYQPKQSPLPNIDSRGVQAHRTTDSQASYKITESRNPLNKLPATPIVNFTPNIRQDPALANGYQSNSTSRIYRQHSSSSSNGGVSPTKTSCVFDDNKYRAAKNKQPQPQLVNGKINQAKNNRHAPPQFIADLKKYDTNKKINLKKLAQKRNEIAAESPEELLKVDKNGDTRLHLFILEVIHDEEMEDDDVLAMVVALCEHYKMIGKAQFIDKPNNLEQTPLVFAVILQDPFVVKVLLDFGADPNVEYKSKDKYISPVHKCVSEAKSDYKDVLEVLLQNPKTNINKKNSEHYTALHILAMMKFNMNREFVDLLLNYGAKTNISNDNTGSNTLQMALKMKNIPLVKKLLERSENPKDLINQKDNAHNTSLHIVAGLDMQSLSAHKELLQEMLEKGADKNARNRDRRFPYNLVKPNCYKHENGCKELTKLLQNPKPPKNQRNSKTSTSSSGTPSPESNSTVSNTPPQSPDRDWMNAPTPSVIDNSQQGMLGYNYPFEYYGQYPSYQNVECSQMYQNQVFHQGPHNFNFPLGNQIVNITGETVFPGTGFMG